MSSPTFRRSTNEPGSQQTPSSRENTANLIETPDFTPKKPQVLKALPKKIKTRASKNGLVPRQSETPRELPRAELLNDDRSSQQISFPIAVQRPDRRTSTSPQCCQVLNTSSNDMSFSQIHNSKMKLDLTPVRQAEEQPLSSNRTDSLRPFL